jgi:hypothetical protein
MTRAMQDRSIPDGRGLVLRPSTRRNRTRPRTRSHRRLRDGVGCGCVRRENHVAVSWPRLHPFPRLWRAGHRDPASPSGRVRRLPPNPLGHSPSAGWHRSRRLGSASARRPHRRGRVRPWLPTLVLGRTVGSKPGAMFQLGVSGWSREPAVRDGALSPYRTCWRSSLMTHAPRRAAPTRPRHEPRGVHAGRRRAASTGWCAAPGLPPTRGRARR